jgi:hypothetical protein
MKVPAASPSRDPHHPPAPRITSPQVVICHCQGTSEAPSLGARSHLHQATIHRTPPGSTLIKLYVITISSYNRVRNSTTLTDSPNSEESVLRAIIAAFARSVSLYRRRLSTRQVSTPHQPPSPIPRPHPSISNSRDISARGAHSCALVRSLSLSIACDSTHHSNPAEHPLSSSWPSSPCMSRHVGAGPPATPPGIVMAASTRCSPLRAPACPWS